MRRPVPASGRTSRTTCSGCPPSTSDREASVYEHAARTLDKSLTHGAHDLPLMGTGDWNDGMNRVGHEGRGESVWLGWFLLAVVDRFAPIAEARGEPERAAGWRASRERWHRALNDAGWDGDWFRRAFFDDGSPLGSAANAECRIDLIAQAWAVLSNGTSDERQRQAMAAVRSHLLDDTAGVVRLLDPPLAHALPSAGYIQAYPPGVRENGGQYSHAGVWAVLAFAARGDADAAWRTFRYLSPPHRSRDPKQGAAYGIEPYVMPGDVYTAPPYVGRGGWSWYTGSASWMHRAAIEGLFGFRRRGDLLSFAPCLPPAWPTAELALTRDGRTVRIVFTRSAEPVPAGARTLARDEPFRWSDTPTGSVFHVVASAVAPAASDGATRTVPIRPAAGVF
jgi:cyclic beta-1,2-glucan synthetase